MSTIALKIESGDDGLVARVPTIGRVSLFSQLPQVLTEGAVVGQITTLRSVRNLTMPAGGPWVLRKTLIASRDVGMGVHTALLSLRLWDESAAAEQTGAAGDGGVFYTSPMSGQYYLRPAPDQAPFIQVGDVIEPGTQIGLVEVMKFFYPLIFEDEGRWRILEILTGESKSLDAGDAVLRLEAL